MKSNIISNTGSFAFAYHADIDLFTVTDKKNYNMPFLMYGDDGDGKVEIRFREYLLSEENIKMGYFLYGYCASQKEISFYEIFPNG